MNAVMLLTGEGTLVILTTHPSPTPLPAGL
jgi:hypothetical protein